MIYVAYLSFNRAGFRRKQRLNKLYGEMTSLG